MMCGRNDACIPCDQEGEVPQSIPSSDESDTEAPSVQLLVQSQSGLQCRSRLLRCLRDELGLCMPQTLEQ